MIQFGDRGTGAITSAIARKLLHRHVLEIMARALTQIALKLLISVVVDILPGEMAINKGLPPDKDSLCWVMPIPCISAFSKVWWTHNFCLSHVPGKEWNGEFCEILWKGHDRRRHRVHGWQRSRTESRWELADLDRNEDTFKLYRENSRCTAWGAGRITTDADHQLGIPSVDRDDPDSQVYASMFRWLEVSCRLSSFDEPIIQLIFIFWH